MLEESRRDSSLIARHEMPGCGNISSGEPQRGSTGTLVINLFKIGNLRLSLNRTMVRLDLVENFARHSGFMWAKTVWLF
jgi:hypothetical protein